jgi:hypothetical protein
MEPTAWPAWVTVVSTAWPTAETVSARPGAAGLRAPEAAEVVEETTPPAVEVVFSTAWAAVFVRDDGAGAGVGGVLGVDGAEGVGEEVVVVVVVDVVVVDVPPPWAGDEDAAGASPELGEEEDVGCDGDAVPPPPRFGVEAAGVRVGDGRRRLRLPEAVWRVAARGDTVALVRRTGTVGSVVTAASSAARSAAAAVRGLAASSVEPSVRAPSGSRMLGQPWNASAAERIASTIPPAAITDPDAPTTPAKARK